MLVCVGCDGFDCKFVVGIGADSIKALIVIVGDRLGAWYLCV